MFVCVIPKKLLSWLRALVPLVGDYFPNLILGTVQLEATEGGRGVLRATSLAAWAEVQVPLLKVIGPGVVQLPAKPVTRAIGDVKIWSVNIEEILPGIRYAIGGVFAFLAFEEVL